MLYCTRAIAVYLNQETISDPNPHPDSHIELLKMFRTILLRALALQFAFRSAVSAFAFNSSVCVDPTGYDSCWNKANSDAMSIFKKYCTNGICTDVDDCFTPDETCAKITTCIAYTEWINCALNHCWNRVSILSFSHVDI